MKIFRAQFECGICAYAKTSRTLNNAKCPRHGKEYSTISTFSRKCRVNLNKAMKFCKEV